MMVFSLSRGLCAGLFFSVPFHILFFSKAREGKGSGYCVFSRANVAPDDVTILYLHIILPLLLPGITSIPGEDIAKSRILLIQSAGTGGRMLAC